MSSKAVSAYVERQFSPHPDLKPGMEMFSGQGSHLRGSGGRAVVECIMGEAISAV